MGMFDDLTIPTFLLPKPLPKFIKGDEHSFQTKSFDCLMDLYCLNADHMLVLESNAFFAKNAKKTVMNYHGDVFITDSNISAAGPRKGKYVVYTVDGVDAESVTYKLRFTNGKLTTIVLDVYEKQPARNRELWDADYEEEQIALENKIRLRAYELYLSGRSDDAVSNWLEAEYLIDKERLNSVY